MFGNPHDFVPNDLQQACLKILFDWVYVALCGIFNLKSMLRKVI